MKLFKFSFYLSMVLLFGCASTSEIVSEFDETADFDSYTTFVLCIDDLFVENIEYPRYDNNEVREIIGEEVEAQMIKLGHKTNVLNPELQAGFQLIVEEKEASFTNCERQDEYSYWEECTIDTIIYTEETLVIYVSDFNKRQIVWQASVSCDMNRSKDRLSKYINELVTTLFKEYPKS
ncbi:MAG: DUF4136 domain-containing protein [Flavobacteriaceae bacterium]|nr:DUF4136 domain-containing protein [Bacteroidia bacterium]MBT8287749.1 DUF4136 domain-containing protein [Bacteroidia bacterium]NNF74641.1 DUF4136 domain-containing protein [Flavobacteriaceae bacterium]NNK74044.1 DUF4136 domain-containing protein [Flavobacteriaceae bacterium]